MNPSPIIQSLRQVAGQPPLRWLLGLKALYLATVVGAVLGWSSFDAEKFYAVNARWPREGGPVFASHFATWDAAHYLYLSEVGYAQNVKSCAFYPLWPLLVRWSSPLAGGSHVLAGMVLANVFSVAGWVLFHWLVARRWGAAAANWSLVFLVAFPGSLFFQFSYTESLFLVLVLVLWWGLEERRYGRAFVAAGLLPLARGLGVFAVLPIAWHVVEPVLPGWLKPDGRQSAPQDPSPCDGEAPPHPALSPTGGEGARRAEEGKPQSRVARPEVWRGQQVGKPALQPARMLALLGPVAGRAWLLAAPLLGWGVYLALMAHWTGNPFEGFDAQKHWRVHSISNLWNVPKFVMGLFTPTEWHEFRGSVLDRCVFLLLLDCLVLIWRLDKGLLVWTYMLGILPAMSGTFTSFTRFASCAFPLFIALGVFVRAEGGGRNLRNAERRTRNADSPPGPRPSTLDPRHWTVRIWLRNGLLAVFATLHIVLVWRFVSFRWAG